MRYRIEFPFGLIGFGLLSLLSTVAWSADAASSKEKDIVDTAVGAGNFKTLVAAVKAAGLVETLKGAGPFTGSSLPLLRGLCQAAGRDLGKPAEAGEKYKLVADPDLPRRARQGHGCGCRQAFQRQDRARLGGEDQRGVDGKVHVDKATVVITDIPASNGVIHVIDAVILPQ